MSFFQRLLWFVGGVLLWALFKLIFDNILYAGLIAWLKRETGFDEGTMTALVTANLIPILAAIAVIMFLHWLIAQQHADPLAAQRGQLVDIALNSLPAAALAWLRSSHIAGRPNSDAVGTALYEARLIDRDYTGWTEVKLELKPIVAKRLQRMDSRWRNSAKGALRRLEPIHVIIFGLVFVIGGVAWQLSRGTSSVSQVDNEKAIASIRRELASSKQLVAVLEAKIQGNAAGDALLALANKAGSAAPAQSAARLNEKQVRDLLDALHEAKAIVDQHISPTSIEIEQLVANTFGNLQAEGETKRFPKLLRAAHDKLKADIWDQIDGFVYKKYSAYEPQLRIVFRLDDEAAKGALNRSLLQYADAIEALPDKPSPAMLALIKQQADETVRQSNVLYNWMVQVRNRVASVTTNLQMQGVIGIEK